MNSRIINGNNPWNGSIEITELPPEDWPGNTASNRDHIASCHRYTWRPPVDLLLEEISISFICVQGSSGQRRFMPERDMEFFLKWSGAIGHAILVLQGKIQSDLLLTYDQFRLLGHYVQHTREFIGSTRKIEQELWVNMTARLAHSDEDKDVLPHNVGLDAEGAGQRWSRGVFVDHGLEAATAAGVVNPTPKDIFAYGLSTAARRCPLPLQENEVPPLIRAALFSLGPAPFPPDKAGQSLKSATIKFVAEEFAKAIKGHLSDSDEVFNIWLNDSKSNLVHRISKKVRCPSDRPGVRQALLELGAKAIWLQGDGIDAMMRDFYSLIPEPLIGDEADIFEQCYLKTPRFGNLPLVLIRERFKLFEPVIKSMWSNPNSELELNVFYRVLSWFSEILDLRRSADRRKKNRKDAIPEKQRAPSKKPSFSPSTTASIFGKDKLQSVIEKSLKCDLELHDWEIRPLNLDELQSSAPLKFLVFCPTLNIDAELEISKEALAKIRDES